MKNYVQYHLPERRAGAPAKEAASEEQHSPEDPFPQPYFYIYTNKNKPDILGSQIWLFEGVGRPRRYYLAEVFIADRVIPANDRDFFYHIGGENGQRFDDPPLEVTHIPWFQELRRRQGNFAFGLNELDERFVKILETFVEQYK